MVRQVFGPIIGTKSVWMSVKNRTVRHKVGPKNAQYDRIITEPCILLGINEPNGDCWQLKTGKKSVRTKCGQGCFWVNKKPFVHKSLSFVHKCWVNKRSTKLHLCVKTGQQTGQQRSTNFLYYIEEKTPHSSEKTQCS